MRFTVKVHSLKPFDSVDLRLKFETQVFIKVGNFGNHLLSLHQVQKMPLDVAKYDPN
jgi:hypothetical protein